MSSTILRRLCRLLNIFEVLCSSVLFHSLLFKKITLIRSGSTSNMEIPYIFCFIWLPNQTSLHFGFNFRWVKLHTLVAKSRTNQFRRNGHSWLSLPWLLINSFSVVGLKQCLTEFPITPFGSHEQSRSVLYVSLKISLPFVSGVVSVRLKCHTWSSSNPREFV